MQNRCGFPFFRGCRNGVALPSWVVIVYLTVSKILRQNFGCGIFKLHQVELLKQKYPIYIFFYIWTNNVRVFLCYLYQSHGYPFGRVWAKKKLVWLTSKESVINWLSKSNILTQTKRKLVLISKKTFYFVHKLALKRLTKNVYHYKYSKNDWFLRQLMNLILKSTLMKKLKKNSSCTFWRQPWFQRQLKLFTCE